MTVNFSIEILKWLTLLMKICSLKTLTILFTIFIFTAFCNTQAMQKGSLEYLENRFDYSTLNPFELIQAGDIYFEQALNTKNKLKREKFFRYAMGKYFLTSKLILKMFILMYKWVEFMIKCSRTAMQNHHFTKQPT